MDPIRWQRARALFDIVVELPESAWDAFLAAQEDDGEVRSEARAMLVADLSSRTVAALAEHSPDLVAALAEEAARSGAQSLIGQRFGAWQLLQLLGQGGMGAVYLAERIEGGFRQRAALKRVRPGIGIDDLTTRFHTERQILAGLEHPNIARLLDGGAGPDGEPFLALEYIEGTDLRSHCDAQRLDVRERLRLFLTVCDAVAHAHTRLVVHRDLKPGNILVTPDGTVKLLDFGVAKLIDPATPTEATAARLRLYTPEYAAPEQIRGEPSTTAVDVHALGVVLYELLTGRRPFSVVGGSSQAIESAVLTQDAPRPSAAITTRLPDADTCTTAEQRRLAPAQVRALLRGDLDAIVQRALRKSPQERYPTVRALADDVRAWLDRRPVQARRGNARYRIARFVQRHALATGLATALLAALIVGLGVALWQANAARTQRDLAQREASKARAALDFMTGLFSVADPEVVQGRDVTARELLERGAGRIRSELHDQPAVRAELLHAMGQAHLGLGLYEEALPLLDEARDGAPDPLANLLSRADALHELGRYQDALDLLEPLRAQPDPAQRARMHVLLAQNHQALNQLEPADDAYRHALTLQRGALGPQHRQTRETELRYVYLRVLRGEYEDAFALSARLLQELRDAPDTDAALLGRVLGAHAVVVSNTGPMELAESLRREQIEVYARVYDANHPRIISARNDLATVFYGQRRYDEAEPLFAQALEARRAQYGAEHPAVATAASNLANTWLAMRQHDRALPMAEEALRVRLSVYGENHHTTALSLYSLGVIEMERGRAEPARTLLERGLAAYIAAFGQDNPQILSAMNELIAVRLRQRDPDPDCALASRALALSKAQSTPGQPGAQYQFGLLGACRALGGEAAGRAPLDAAVAAMREALGDEDRRVRYLIALQKALK